MDTANAVKITINKLSKTFTSKVKGGYVLGYIKKNDNGDKIWYSTFISEKLIWNTKVDFNKVYDIVLPFKFVFNFKIYNLDTKEQGLETDEFEIKAVDVAQIIMKKDSKNKSELIVLKDKN